MRRKSPAPKEFAHILVWHRDLRDRCLRGFRFEPVQYSEILAYRDAYHLDMDAFDIDLLVAVDNIWQRAQPDPNDKPQDLRGKDAAAPPLAVSGQRGLG